MSSLAGEVVGHSPDLVCAPIYIFNRPYVLEALGRIKALLPQVLIAVGGPECLGGGAKELIAKNEFIDFACQGEGEAMMPLLLDAIAEGRNIAIPGVVSRENSENATARIFDDWANSYEIPCLDEFYDFTKGFVQVETSRGCPNHCAFCTSAGVPVRYRPLDSVRREFTILEGHGVREIRLLDRTFNMPPSRAVELLKIFRTEFPKMHFHLEFNPCIMPQNLRDELRMANDGQLHIEAGMQSMHEEVVDAIGRVHTCEKAIEGLKFLCSLPGVVVHSDLISGLPEQTLSGLYDDIVRMGEIGPGEIQLEVLKILKGTALEDAADELGLRHSPFAPFDVMCTPWMSASEIIEARYLSRILDLFYNTAVLQEAFRKCLGASGFLKNFLEWLRCNGMDLGPSPSLKKRFLWMYDYIKGKGYSEAMDALRISWMKESFGAAGPCADAECMEKLEGVLLDRIAGSEADDISRDARYYRLVCSDGRGLVFVYNRGVAPNKAIAVYCAQE